MRVIGIIAAVAEQPAGTPAAQHSEKGGADERAIFEWTVAGRPMVDWTLEHALASRGLNVTAVASNVPAVAQVAEAYPFEIIRRSGAMPPGGLEAVAQHALLQVERRMEVVFDAVVILDAKIVVRPVDLAERAVLMLRDTGCDVVQSQPVEDEDTSAAGADGGVLAVRRNALFDEQQEVRRDIRIVPTKPGQVIAVRDEPSWAAAERALGGR